MAGYTAGRLLGSALGMTAAAAGAAGHLAWYVAYLLDAGAARADQAVSDKHRRLRDPRA